MGAINENEMTIEKSLITNILKYVGTMTNKISAITNMRKLSSGVSDFSISISNGLNKLFMHS